MAQIPSSVKPVRPVTKPWKGSKVLPVAAVSDALLHPGKTVDYDGKKVTFRYFDWTAAGGKAYRRDGALYETNPVALCVDTGD